MNRKRLLLMISLALIAASVAGLMSFQKMKMPNRIALPGPSAATEKVMVALRDLPVGTLITSEDVQQADFPKKGIPSGALRSIQDAVGRTVIAPIYASETMQEGRLSPLDGGSGLSAAIPQGMRAVSVKVDEVIGVAGFVLPGTFVDVLTTVDPKGGNSEAVVTNVILQNIKALAVDQSLETVRDGSAKPQASTVITLLVDPVQAERLILASTKGRIQLALRNPLDEEYAETKGANLASLVVSQPKPEPKPRPVRRVIRRAEPVESPVVVESFNGMKKSSNAYKKQNP